MLPWLNIQIFFQLFFINLVKVGENTGTLDTVFMHLAEYLALELDITKKIKVALRYPIMVISAIIIASIVINVFVVPSFAKLYATMQGELPLPTLILIGFSNFIIHYWYVLILLFILAILGVREYLSTPKGARQWGYLQLKIPIIGWIIQRVLLSRFARLLSLVLRAGITAIEGIEMIGASTNNAYVAERIRSINDLIIRGNSISTAIEKTGLFSPLVIQMIALGEESGTIDNLLDEVASFYQREVDYDISRLSETIEPILLVVIGGMVLILALAVFLPTWNLATLMKKH